MKTKYLLIQLDKYKLAGTQEVLTALQARPDVHGVVESFKPITLAALKKIERTLMVYDRADSFLRRVQFQDVRAEFHNKTVTAKVRWFDKMRGEGTVSIEGAGTFPIYACNIKGRKTWYPETACVYYEAGQEVQVKIDVHTDTAIFILGVTQGHFDSEGWDRIKDQPLAFKCDEQGNPINGLFA
jgi:hypothetical protein